MRRSTCHHFLFLALLVSGLSSFSQSPHENSLLWRISGNGLLRPSFLFGTMHVYDKQAFNFEDSLYIYLNGAEGFALEFDPDSTNAIMEAYVNGSLKTDEDEKPNYRISSSDLKEMRKKITLDTAYKAKESDKNMVDYFISRLVASDKKQKNSMNTFMDAFLYQVAKQTDKRMYGLETLETQIKALRALSKGVKMNKFVSLIGKWQNDEESPVAELYYRENIDSINIFYSNYFSEETLDGFLYDRNKAMAAQMDSLMKLQSMFTAVGAAHLGGARGVIALLRQRGYSVEPVFSSQRIPASEYKLKTVSRQWQLIKDDQLGLEFEMPAKPMSQDGEAGRNVTYYYDLGEGLVYMTICGRPAYKAGKDSSTVINTKELDELVSKIDGKKLSSKMINADGLKGLEVVCLGKENSYFRIFELTTPNMFYIFSLTSQKKDSLYSENAEKYFSSFKHVAIPPTNWAPYEFADDGFAISFPGNPKVKPLKLKDGSNVTINSYTFFDANSGVNYTITSGKTKPFNDYVSDESFFKGYISALGEGVDGDSSRLRDTVINGFPGKSFRKPSLVNNWKGFVVKRNHSSYFLVAEYNPGTGAQEAEKFLQSFSMTNYRQPEWSPRTYSAGDFSCWSPSEIFRKEDDSSLMESRDNKTKYYTYDPYSGLTYFIESEPVNEYYWAPNIDSVYDDWKNQFVNRWSDSLLSYQVVKNGGITGRELLIRNKFDSSVKRQRMLLSGNTMYSFYLGLPDQLQDSANIDRFFKEFKISDEKPADGIIQNTPNMLFTDLLSKDSVIFRKAVHALSLVKFRPSELPLLMQKSLLPYMKDESEYLTVNSRLLSIASGLFGQADSTIKKQVFNFIEEAYDRPGKEVEKNRVSLLEIMAIDTVQESFDLLRKLLNKRLAVGGNEYPFFSRLGRTPRWTETLYPDILYYLPDTTMGPALASLTKTLIDSNVLKPEILQPVKPSLLKLARWELKSVLKSQADDQDFDYRIPDIIGLMSIMKQNETDEMVAGFLKVKPVSIRKDAAIALIKNGKPVSPAILNKIATDRYERTNLYEGLENCGKLKLFPSAYRSQQKLAEGYIFRSIMDDGDDERPSTDPGLIYIKKVEKLYQGEKKRFFYFRVNFPQTPDTTVDDVSNEADDSYLAIAGPFDLDENRPGIDPEKNITGLYYEKKFDGDLMDEYFRKFLEARSNWQQ